jgi:hypothetical protein
MTILKKISDAVWDFLVAWGEFRYQQSKLRNSQMY